LPVQYQLVNDTAFGDDAASRAVITEAAQGASTACRLGH